MATENGESGSIASLGRDHARELVMPVEGLDVSIETVSENISSKNFREGPLNGICVVCEDPRGSVHFGVVSCAACSAFFRRTISENRKYSCRRNSEGRFSCPINQKHRCYCRACRLQKCLSVGMDPGSVQLHRDTYGSKPVKRSQSEPSCQKEITNRGNLQQDCVDFLLSSTATTAVSAEQLFPFSHTSSCLRRGLGNAPYYFEGDTAAFETLVHYREGMETSPPVFSSAAKSSMTVKQESIEDNRTGNMIEMMVKSYKQMLERRRLFYCPSSIRDILGGTEPTVRPACYFGERVRRDRLRVDIALLVEFLNSISPFPLLDLDDRVALMKRFSVSFSIVEKYYITMRVGGLQTNRIFHSDGTYSDLNDPDSIAKEANKVSGGGVDKETLNKLFVQTLKDFLLELSVPMYHNKMTDVEFCALNAILLFDPVAPGLSAIGSRLVRQARDQVYYDWFEHYQKTGVEDIGQRVGNTMLLLPAVQTIVDTTQENFRLIQVFDLFQYDKILDELMYLDD